MKPEAAGVIATFMIFLIPITAIIVGYFMRRLQSQERLKAIEKGVPIPMAPAADPVERAARTRKNGIILVAAGLGWGFFMIVTAVISQQKGAVIAMAFGAIPILIGLGLVYEYRLRSREIAQAK